VSRIQQAVSLWKTDDRTDTLIAVLIITVSLAQVVYILRSSGQREK
jgi:hypothetical protein